MTETAILAVIGALFTLQLATLGVTLHVAVSLAKLEVRMNNFEHPEGYHA